MRYPTMAKAVIDQRCVAMLEFCLVYFNNVHIHVICKLKKLVIYNIHRFKTDKILGYLYLHYNYDQNLITNRLMLS